MLPTCPNLLKDFRPSVSAACVADLLCVPAGMASSTNRPHLNLLHYARPSDPPPALLRPHPPPSVAVPSPAFQPAAHSPDRGLDDIVRMAVPTDGVAATTSNKMAVATPSATAASSIPSTETPGARARAELLGNRPWGSSLTSDSLLTTVSRRVVRSTRCPSSTPGPSTPPSAPRDARRDLLVLRLRRCRSSQDCASAVPSGEADATRRLLATGGARPGTLAALARLWGVPAAAVSASAAAERGPGALLRFYRAYLSDACPDTRLARLLAGPGVGPVPREALRKLFAKTLGGLGCGAVAPELALFALGDARAPGIPRAMLRGAGVAGALRAFEALGRLMGPLAPLQPRRRALLAQDLASARSRGPLDATAVAKYCADRGLLTPRAVEGVFTRHVAGSVMSEAEFGCMYLALVDCASDAAVLYWFAVLDADGDGALGPADVATFYKARRAESERSNGVTLIAAPALYHRLEIAARAAGKRAYPGGISRGQMLAMDAKDREFLLCALLLCRPDDGLLHENETAGDSPAAEQTVEDKTAAAAAVPDRVTVSASSPGAKALPAG